MHGSQLSTAVSRFMIKPRENAIMKTERAPMTCAVAAVSLLYAYVGSLATDLREVIRGRTRLSPLALALIVGVSAALIGVAAALLTTYTRRQLRRWGPLCLPQDFGNICCAAVLFNRRRSHVGP